ncbi:hypothetical protein MRB53_039433 [Persea americana]|nr:hypothetical protein MRB53_039433 [Persea americana]
MPHALLYRDEMLPVSFPVEQVGTSYRMNRMSYHVISSRLARQRHATPSLDSRMYRNQAVAVLVYVSLQLSTYPI